MPSKKNQRKTQRRKQVTVSRGMVSRTPLQKRICTLVFSANLSLTEAAAGAGVYNFYRLNGPYDPDTAVLSNSTPGLAALAQLYRSMRVLSAGVEAAGNWHCTPNIGTCTLCLVPTAFQPVLPSNPAYWPVQPDAVSVATSNHTYGSSFTVGTFPPVRRTWKLNDVMNVTRSQYVDEADFATLTNSNPTRQAYVAVAVYTNSPAVVATFLQVKVKYQIEFFDPYPLQ